MTSDEQRRMMEERQLDAEQWERDHRTVQQPTALPTPYGIGWTFTWTTFNGDSYSVGSDIFATAEEAWEHGLRLATLYGWTPPKWWQWWRWGDKPRSTTMPK